MHHDETVAAVARKLYRFSKKDVAEVLDVLIEVWQAQLLQPDAVVHIKGLGKLRIDEQEIKTNVAVRRLLEAQQKVVPKTLKRYYFRFSPSEKFKQQAITHRQNQEDKKHE